MSIQLGYLLPTRERVMSGDSSTAGLLDMARYAADLGINSLWAGDSLTARPRHDPLTLLAATSAVVPHVKVGTAVLLPALRNPVVLAQQLATVDQISEGRLIVGAGIAGDIPPVRAEFATAGVPFAGRVGRFMEGMRLCKALWRGEPVSWDGRWQVDNASLAPTSFRPEGPPIWLGTGAEAGIARAARHFDGWFPIGPDVQTFALRQASFAQAAHENSRHQLTTALYMTLCIQPDAGEANQVLDTYLEDYYGVAAQMMRGIQACYAGPFEGAVDFMRSYVAAGASHIVLRLVGDHKAQLKLITSQRELIG